ncbi:MAG TPA: transposase zinc-binding domain-containing protein, partial [Pyrinomonadaceae bacterium]
MTTLGEIVRQYGPAYRAQYGEQLLPSQQAALQAIEQCRTEALGGQVYTCPACGSKRYSYHSCRNRHCPTCQQDAAQTWLERQQELLLPVPYFLVTFTLPAELRAVAYRHQRTLYNLLFRAS